MVDKLPFRNDESHKWGTYRELQLTCNWMSRLIRFYLNGRTSIHKHPVDEVVIVELGKVICYSGKDPENLEVKIYGPGEQMYLPANVWHACGAVEGISEKMPFAIGIEYIWGKIHNGDYRIERYAPSIKSKFKKKWKNTTLN